ncbi:MAG: hypothetical protein IPK80_02905 [Nannocystis sp.]|nr:hypothetical protein [Nannocystis sp.]
MGRLWARLDLNAGLTGRLTIPPIDPDALASVERDLLGEWANDWDARQKAAYEAAKG